MAEVHVQTTVPEPLYEALWRTARRQNRPLRAIVRDAIEAYLATSTPLDSDPLRDFVGRGTLEAGAWSERKDWRA